MKEKKCPFCAATQGTCGCLRLLDSVLVHTAGDSTVDNPEYLLNWVEKVVEERVKRYGGVAK
jgi:hypothetical protein